MPWNYLPRELPILPLADHVNMDRYVPHNAWDIKDTAVWKPYVDNMKHCFLDLFLSDTLSVKSDFPDMRSGNNEFVCVCTTF